MAAKPSSKDTSEEAAASLLCLPRGARSPDDQEGFEARLLLAGYGELLGGLARTHAPMADIRDVAARITAIVERQVSREMMKHHTSRRKAN
jgi:hypothetical protein